MQPESTHLFLRYRDAQDLDALERALRIALPALQRHARRLGVHPSAADDVVQEALAQAITSAATFDSDGNLEHWLAGIARHVWASHRRNSARRSAALQRLEVPAPPEPPSSLLERRGVAEEVRRAVAELDSPYREVMEGFLAEDARPAAIAARLGRHPGTVRTQLLRGLQLLRSRLRPEVWVLLAAALLHRQAAAALRLAGTGVVAAVSALVLGLVALAYAWTSLRDAPSAGPRVPPAAPATSPTSLAAVRGAAPGEPAIRTPAPGTATELTSTLVLRLRTPSSPLRDLPVVLCAPFVPTEIGLHTHFYRWRVQHTDENGDVRFEGVPRGPIAVRLHDSDENVLRVDLDSAEHRAEIEASPHATVEGTVVDPEGRPIAGADVWLLFQPSNSTSVVATAVSGRTPGLRAYQTLADGRFLVRTFMPQSWVCARHPLYGDSPSRLLAASQIKAEVRLELRRRPLSIRGVVSDADGRPATGATVGVYQGDPVEQLLPRFARTDELGRFSAGGLWEGRYDVHVLGRGCARASVALTADADLVLRLGVSGSLVGKITGIGGDDHTSLRVVVASPDYRTHSGITTLSSQATQVGEGGSFAVDGVPAGPRSVAIVDEHYPTAPRHSCIVQIDAHAVTRLDVHLGATPDWHLEITDGDGVAAAGAEVILLREIAGFRNEVGRALADARGRVVFHRVPPVLHLLSICLAPSNVSHMTDHVLRSVAGGPLLVRVPRRSPARLRAQIAGQPADGGTSGCLYLANQPIVAQRQLVVRPLDDVAVPLPTATASLLAWHGTNAHGPWWLPVWSGTPEPGAEINLGALTFPPMGTLDVRVGRAAGVVRIDFQDRAGLLVQRVWLAGDCLASLRLPAGRGLAKYAHADCSPAEVPFEILPDASAQLVLPRTPGVPCRLEVAFDRIVQLPARLGGLHVAIRNLASGAGRELAVPSTDTSPYVGEFDLAPGRYAITAEVAWARPLTWEITVTAEHDRPVRLDGSLSDF